MNADLSAEQETSRIIQIFSALSLSAFENYNSWKIWSCIKDFPGVGASDHLKWTYSGAFERLFGPGKGIWPTQIPKVQMPRGLPGGGMLNLQFDQYISETKIEYDRRLPTILWLSYSAYLFNYRGLYGYGKPIFGHVFKFHPSQRFANGFPNSQILCNN